MIVYKKIITHGFLSGQMSKVKKNDNTNANTANAKV